jgi:hypothetical protein
VREAAVDEKGDCRRESHGLLQLPDVSCGESCQRNRHEIGNKKKRSSSDARLWDDTIAAFAEVTDHAPEVDIAIEYS